MTRTLLRLGSLALLVVVLVRASPARAEEQCAYRIDPRNAPKAEALVHQAHDAFEASRYDEALSFYDRAFCVLPDPILKHRISATELKLGRCGEAIHDAEFWTHNAAREDRKEARKWAAEVRAQCIEVAVQSEPSGASLFLDWARAPFGVTPWHGYLLAGHHTLSAHLLGYTSARQPMLVPASSGPITFALSLQKEAPPQAPEVIVAPPPEVTPPPRPLPAPVMVSITPKAQPETQPTVPPQALAPAPAEGPKPYEMSTGRKMGIAAMAVGGAALIVGIVLGVTSNNAATAAKTKAPTGSIGSEVSSVNGMAQGADALYAVGGALAAAGAGLTIAFP